MDRDKENSSQPPHVRSPEHDRIELPFYPILDKDQVWDGKFDRRDELPHSDKAEIREDEVVIHIRKSELILPSNKLDADVLLMKASRARTVQDIGWMGPTVASVNIHDYDEESRYQRPHGRDDYYASDDVKYVHPKPLDTSNKFLLTNMGVQNEVYVPGQPFGFEKKGSIILVDFEPTDPLGIKFLRDKGWKNRFYASADAPLLVLNGLCDMQFVDHKYLLSPEHLYPSTVDGEVHDFKYGFDTLCEWAIDRMNENAEGLIEYSNPYSDGRGMRNQGWKDSADAIVHKNGEWANSNGGIATIEIQAQAVISLRKAARINRAVFGDLKWADELDDRASHLLNFVIQNGWVERAGGGYFAMGWDRDESGNLRRIETKSIDMHSVLRILDMSDPTQKQMAKATIDTLLSPAMFTRWGTRVMGADEVGYRHKGYHCGIWPDKVNREAESIGTVGFHALDRFVGARPTAAVNIRGCYLEQFSGEDSPLPVIPDKDVYVYNRRYNEVYMAQQVPPLGQTWYFTSEIGKHYRYEHLTPPAAESEEDRRYERDKVAEINERYEGMLITAEGN